MASKSGVRVSFINWKRWRRSPYQRLPLQNYRNSSLRRAWMNQRLIQKGSQNALKPWRIPTVRLSLHKTPQSQTQCPYQKSCWALWRHNERSRRSRGQISRRGVIRVNHVNWKPKVSLSLNSASFYQIGWVLRKSGKFYRKPSWYLKTW